MRIKLLVADDHDIVREGTHKILALTLYIRIAAEAINGAEVMQKLQASAEPADKLPRKRIVRAVGW